MKLWAIGIVATGMWTLAGTARAGDIDFTLLTWNDTQATTELPTATGRKPSNGNGDWLTYTPDDVAPGTSYNPAGALSHNLAQFSGAAGSAFNNAPSLSGTLTLAFAADGPDAWHVSPKAQAYIGVAAPSMQMNQYLIASGDPATQNPAFNVDGIVNPGSWQAHAAANWAITYSADFYFATNVDGNPSLSDADATFDNVAQHGYLIPVDQLTPAGLAAAAAALTSPSGFFAGDFEQYLLNEIAPRLPADATYLLLTQMDKVNPVYAEAGLPITTDSLFGNFTVAYTTQEIPEPASLSLLIGSLALIVLRRRH